MDGSTVSYHLALHLVSGEGHVLPLTAELHYDVADPIAVTALFTTGDEAPVRWVFARDLLEAGLDQPSGEGDVLVWPTHDMAGRPAVHIRLCSPHGDALVEASADEVAEFLAETWRLVGPGEERRHLDVDATIEALLADS